MLFIAGIVLLTMQVSLAQKKHNERIPLIGSKAPTFEANSTNGKISFPKDFGSNWKIIFAHPRDFTPVCSSEILELAYMQDEFKALNTELIVVSTDKLSLHNDWKAALEEVSYKGRKAVKIQFPLVEDPGYSIANSFGMLDSGSDVGQSVRGVFFIDPKNTIRAFYFYPNEIGRNVDEVQRTLVALQTTDADKSSRVVLPANWQPGNDVMITSLGENEKKADGQPDPAQGFYNSAWFMTFKKAN